MTFPFLLSPAVPVAASLLALACAIPAATAAEGFYHFTPAIPENDANGVPLAGANTALADGSGVFRPDVDTARSHRWTWRDYGNAGILHSLGPDSSTLPAETKELVTTISGLAPGSEHAVKALFWSSGGTAAWGLRAGLTHAWGSRANPWFDKDAPGVGPASLLPWDVIPSVFAEGGRTLYAASLGTTTAGPDGRIDVFIHDLPSANSNHRVWYDGVAVSPVADTARHTVDAGSRGTAFGPGVRGIALADLAITRGDHYFGLAKSLEVSSGGSIRGVATGLAADIYDWRTRNDAPRPPTLQFLRYSRDNHAELWLGANMRGLIEPDPAGGYRYYDTSLTTLARMAGDWARYVNHIVPAYRQGDTVANARDAAILESLTWNSATPGDAFDKLLAPDEPAVPKIEYWEVGNEPTIGVSAYSVNNSFTLDPTEFHQRYQAVAMAIKAEDPAIKVGPTLVNGSREGAHLAALVSDPMVPIDFITYHPYEKMGLLQDPAEITRHLGSIHTRQTHFLNEIKRVVAGAGRDPDAIEYGATEVNVSDWRSNETIKEAEVAHALGTVETVFSHARLGLAVSHYWIWPAHAWDGTEYPVFKAYQGLRDHMGDTLLSSYAFGDLRVYATRESASGKLAVWALNFSGSEETVVELKLENLPEIDRATVLRLEDKSGTTTLHSANPASDMAGGPAINVDWNSSDLTGTDFSGFDLVIPPATLTLLVMEPAPLKLIPGFLEQEGETRLAVTFRRLAIAAGLRYRVLGSNDLAAWEVIEEVEPGTPESVTVSDNRPITGAVRRFLRVDLLRQN